MREKYLGTVADRKYIGRYLREVRNLDPIEIVTLPGVWKLANVVRGGLVDTALFWKLVEAGLRECKSCYGVSITTINPSRYYVAVPEGKSDIGGFHDPHSLGYQYWYHAGFVVTLNRGMFSGALIAVELARSFLHDCFHHSTFRSFRRAIRTPATSPVAAKHRVPEIYREQYGFNFRNRDGLSYSAPEFTKGVPETINLNLLMDGVIVLVIADILKELTAELIQPSNDLEAEILKEIFLEDFDRSLQPRAYEFNSSVAMSSKAFVEHWGGKTFLQLALGSMVSGNLSAVKVFFEERTGEPDAWEKRFRRSGFKL